MPCALINPATMRVDDMNPAFASVLARLGDGVTQLLAAHPEVARAVLEAADGASRVVRHPALGLDLVLRPALATHVARAVLCHVLPDAGLEALAPTHLDEAVRPIAVEALHVMPAHLTLCKPSGQCFWVNAQLRHYLYGADAGREAPVESWIEAIHPEDITRYNAWFSRFLVEHGDEGITYRMRHHAGEYHWFHCRAHAVRHAGQLAYIVRLNVNVDSAKSRQAQSRAEAQAMREAHERQLARLELVQQELVRTQKTELVERIAGGISHDLNNLLFVINLNSNMLKQRVTDAQSVAYLDTIHKTIRRASRLATQLVAFSGRRPQAAQAVAPAALVREIEDLLLNAVGAEVEFHVNIDDDLGVVLVDKAYLENSLINLAINARDAVGGRGLVRLHLYNETRVVEGQQRTYVVAEVTDNGVGITPEVLIHIFDPFFTTKGVGKGTGLGLVMVQGFARQAGGFIEVDSELGKGARFKLGIPHSDERPDCDATPTLIPEAGEESLLIVEDDNSVRNSLAQALMELGYQVTTAYNPDVAVKYLRSGLQVDLIISDIRMPGELTVTDMLRMLEQEKRNTPVLLTTGYSGEVLIEDGLVDRKYHVLFKPFSVNELGGMIREILGG